VKLSALGADARSEKMELVCSIWISGALNEFFSDGYLAGPPDGAFCSDCGMGAGFNLASSKAHSTLQLAPERRQGIGSCQEVRDILPNAAVPASRLRLAGRHHLSCLC